MALDGIFLHTLTKELKSAEGMHIDKIHQPSNDELVLLLRGKGENKRLLISANSSSSRVHFTATRIENPSQPPMFCMLLRKYLSSAKIIEISQIGFERVLSIKTSATNEMGDIIYPELIIELIGASSNIILVNDGVIIDALRRSNIENNSRIIHPGAVYALPPKPDKLNLLQCSVQEIIDRIEQYKNEKLDKAILLSVEGVSPLISREIARDDIFVNSLTGYHKNMLIEELKKFKGEVLSGGKPIMLKRKDKTAFDFSCIEIYQYKNIAEIITFDTYSQLLDEFYTERDNRNRIAKQSGDVLKLLTVLSSRAAKRMEGRKKDLKKCENREQLRIFGELLKANLFAIKQGQNFAEVQNYYDENLSLIRIPMNPALSPSQNAAKYFKDYKKSYTAEQHLKKLIESDKQEKEYLDTVLDALSRATTLTDIAAIRNELAAEGYIKRSENVKKKETKQGFGEEISPSGYRVLYGKNNRMNEEITLKTAAKNDMWFHIKNMPGSHVVVICGGKNLSEADMDFAAAVAAKNSSGCNLTTAAVDYTAVKNVKKPAGSKTGMVTYSEYKTHFVRING